MIEQQSFPEPSVTPAFTRESEFNAPIDGPGQPGTAFDLDAFDLDAFARALTAKDIRYVLSRYASDADIRIVDANHAPSAPLIVTGHRSISSWLLACASVQHHLETLHLIKGEDRIGFTQRSRRLDGTIALLTSTAEISRGLITSQHTILA